ncbi:MAG: EAL domain-containing protein [Rhodocyclaceae bacterium]|nr:EAL domain-containing protein [Rhodocyclaceae bacterium]
MLLTNALIAALYGLLGWGALSVSLPPGYSLPIFPPAGLALAAALVFGRRVLPGVALGSAFVQVLVAGEAGPSAVALLIGPAAAVCEALAGTYLMRRRIGYPTSLDAPVDIVQMLTVVAPVGGLVGASIAVPLLTGAGILPSRDIAMFWLVWWLGDTLGIIIALPITLSVIGEPHEDWRSRRFNLGVPIGVALGLLVATLWHLRASEILHAETEFSRNASGIAHQVESRMRSQVDMLLSAQRLITVSQLVDRQEWHDYVTPWFANNPGMLNFTWNPLVRVADREAFVARVRAEGYTRFEIMDRTPDGGTAVAGDAPDGFYVPITYLEPFNPNAVVFGLNPLSIPNTGEAIRGTLADGQPHASKPFRLTQERGEQIGVVLYQGVRKIIDGRLETMGIVSSALRMGDVIGATAAGPTALGIDVCVVDVSDPEHTMRLSTDPTCDDPEWTHSTPTVSTPFHVAGRRWEVRMRPGEGYAYAATGVGTWATVLAGFVSIGLLGAFLLLTTGRTRRIQELVELRTSELAAASRRLLEQQGALAEAQRIAGLGSWQLSADGESVQCSDECRRILGLSSRTRVDLGDFTGSVEEQYQARLSTAIESALFALGQQSQSRQNLDCQVRDRQSHLRTIHILIEGSRATDGRLQLRGTVQDVTAARDTEARIRRLADYDALTGLPNRNYWTTHSRTAIANARRHGDILAVLFIDLDNFKTINDSLGHQVGDHMLTVLAQRLESLLREGDMLARLGGDEFVALLQRLPNRREATVVAEKLLALREKPVSVDGHELPVSMSIGIAVFPDDGMDIETLLKNADMAMYEAKGAGRNACQSFQPEMNARALERLQLDHALHRAIAEQQLFLVYQPQVDVERRRVVGYEALLRWRHPEIGLVSPDRFIPLAELSGLIVPIGDWVMVEAFRQQVILRSSHPDTSMAINISAIQFRRDDFVERVQRALKATGARPGEIELEITESTLMDPTPELLRRLDELRALGFRLSLDDFGTGYSSLTYLKRLPIQALKLDRSFVSDLPGDPEDAAIASATLSMAADLGIEVVAEGVETDAQRRFLQQRGCRLMQGYLFSRPLEARALDAPMQVVA